MDPPISCPADRPPAPPPRTASRSLSHTIEDTAPPQEPSQSPPPLDSSIEDIDLGALEEDLLDDDLLVVPPAKHFLDYDAQPPPGFDETTVIGPNITSHPATASNTNASLPQYEEDNDDDDVDVSSTVAVKGLPNNGAAILYPGEVRKVDKKYETDGEISDFELANYSHSMRARRAEKAQNSDEVFPPPVRPKKKHFLDENPIAPSDISDFEREHRSLDRNYERAKELDPTKSNDRKYSLQPPCGGRRKETTTSFALARFLEQDSVGQPASLPPPMVHRGTWPADRPHDTQQQFGHLSGGVSMPGQPTDGGSASSNDGDEAAGSRSQMGSKVECVYSLLSMLGCSDKEKLSRKFLELSRSPDTCVSLRHSRCIPLIVQIIHSDADEQTRKDASTALHNVVNCHPDDKAGRREAKVLLHIEHVLEYSESLKQMLCDGEALADDRDRHPLRAMSSLMKISFDEEHRHAMCQLGALQAIASVVQYDHAMHGNVAIEPQCVTLRRYSAMALTNLTFGDGYNKAALCANKEFMRAFVAQLNSNVEDLLPVTANVLRNLSWRADNTMKHVLNEIGTVTALTKAVMRNQNESTIKALLSALWNLSAHCSTNKAEFCTVDGALAFLVDMLQYEGPSKSLTIIENAGGILRNVSSHIAVNESYRAILRQRNCLGILLQQLSSESLTIVSNACGTLWNLSARCAQDQQFLLDNNAVRRLSLLLPSKHKMISNGSSAALKNLMNFQPSAIMHSTLDPVAKAMRLKELPTLNVRKQRAFEQALDQNLGETCDNIETTTPSKETHKAMDMFLKHSRQQYQSTPSQPRLTKSANYGVQRSDSKDSVLRSGPPKPGSTPPTPRRSISKPNHDPSSSNPHPVSNGPYQETDLDQITDFSLRYGELPNGDCSDTEDAKAGPSKPQQENPLALDDSVKCYETEGTPYVISNAASVTDLTRGIKAMSVAEPKKLSVRSDRLGAIENSGINTPERCTNYCEEGTPGVYDSYSSLDEADEIDEANTTKSLVVEATEPIKPSHHEEESEYVPVSYRHPEDDEDEERDPVPKSLVESECGTNAPTTPGEPKLIAIETPMMFSRHSSMESLSSIEPALAMDDRSSVVSDFSRVASGIISPSEIPDSPSQMVAHSPRRSSGGAAANFFPVTPPSSQFQQQQQPLRSVFEDDVNTFGVENTPAQFSCATSLSNLSLDDEPKIASDILAKEQKLIEANPIAPKSTDGRRQDATTSEDSDEDAEADKDLLAACINIGMNKPAAAVVVVEPIPEPPVDRPPIPGPKPVKPQHDESLSSLSMDSEDDGDILRQAIAAGSQKMQKIAPPPPKPTIPPFQSNLAEDSFSSIDSIESGDPLNDASLLEHCIQAGLNKKDPAPAIPPPPTKPRIPERVSSSPKRSQLPLFKSPSQIERDRQRERDRKDEALLMECIQTGMAKTRPISVPQAHTSNFRRDLLLGAHQAAFHANDSSHQHHHSQPPAQPKNVQTTSVAATADTPSVRCTASGVDQTTPCQLRHPSNPTTITANTTTTPSTTIQPVADKNGRKSDPSCPTITPPAPVDTRLIRSGFNNGSHHLTTPGVLLDQSLASLSDFSQTLDRSNEFPAMMRSNDACVDADSPKMDTSAMDESNEFLTDDRDRYNESDSNDFAGDADLSDEEFVSEVARDLQNDEQSRVTDKHKDPDLMMQSVERLTQELMSTAEMLRTVSHSNEENEPTVYERKSSSTNTWNEDTCPNEISFPSISWTVPVIADDDDDDATISKENARPVVDTRSFILGQSNAELDSDDFINGTSQPESLDADTATLVPSIDDSTQSDSGIRFHVGGPTFRDHRLYRAAAPGGAVFNLATASAASGRSFTCADPDSTSASSDMTNSTIIALEANKLASELLNMHAMTDSSNSLDLDAIRPPSGMDMVSGYFEPSSINASTGGPPFSPQLARRKKSLPAGLMAKRALHQFTAGAGSMESVHSSCNLDNVKPPSIMDDLLDSMISVASITSEVASPNHSRYDTAMSQTLVHDDDDDTTTLRSCYDDLPTDPDQATPVASDFSSAESTPRKQRCVRRALTAKQKRIAAKERYRTYTIAADMMLMDSDAPSDEGSAVEERKEVARSRADVDVTTTNMVHVEIVKEPSRLMTPRQRRTEDRSRFQTQIIDTTLFADLNSSGDSIAHRQRLQTFSSQEDDNEDAFPQRSPAPFHKFHAAVIDTTSSGSNSLDDDADMSSIRALTERFRFISEALPTAPAPTALPTVVRKLASLTQKRSPQEQAVESNSLDFEQTSETESCYQNHCIDDETYNVTEPAKVVAKPKIVKPSMMVEPKTDDASSNDEPEAKAIRGKKKAAYVSPYRKSVTTSPPRKTALAATPSPSPPKRGISKLMTPRSSQANIVTKTHVLTNKSSLTTKQNLAVKSGLIKPGFSSPKTTPEKSKNTLKSTVRPVDKSPASPRPSNGRPSIPAAKTKPTTKLTPPPAMPERQGTFVKDEPTHADAPVVSSAPQSPAKTSRLPSKLPSASATPTKSPSATNISRLKHPLQRSASNGNAKVSPPPKPLPQQYRQPANQSQTDLSKRRTAPGGFYRSPSTPSVPMRSYSNSSLKSNGTATSATTPNSSQPPSRSNSNLSKHGSTTGGITSRIAGLWKKPEAAKPMAAKASAVTGKPPSAGRLIRSSTFDNTPEEDDDAHQLEMEVQTVVMRAKPARVANGMAACEEAAATKRISRLGTFINMEETVA